MVQPVAIPFHFLSNCVVEENSGVQHWDGFLQRFVSVFDHRISQLAGIMRGLGMSNGKRSGRLTAILCLRASRQSGMTQTALDEHTEVVTASVPRPVN
jgi:hypothetical protein